MPKIPAERIVLRSPNWLGDAMMMTPSVTALRQLYPQSHIAVVTKTSLADVWSANPHVSEVIQLPKSRSAKNIYQFSQSLREKKFNLGILFTNSISSTLEFAWAKIPKRLGTPNGIRRLLLTHAVCPDSQTQHTVEQYLELVRYLGDVLQTPDMLFPISDESKKSAEKLLKGNNIISSDKVIGINPGAAFGTAKRWLPERFIELANELAKGSNTKIVLFGGKDESQDIQKIADNIKPNAINLAGKTSLGELGACISRCNLFVTNDSGPMHIASALGVPMVAIFGSTNLKSTGPIGKGKIEIVQNQPECAPCLLRECPIDHRCMTSIITSDVLQACKSLLV
jgi:heptosyltransferase II